MILDNLRDKKEQFKQEITGGEKAVERIIQEIGSVYGAEVYASRKSSEYLKSSTGWIYACVNAIADYTAGIRIKLMQVKGTDVKEIDSHPALDLLYRANNATTYFDLVKMTFQFLELTGEAPWFISFDNKKMPSQIVLLRPDRLSIIPGKDGEIIGGYKYRVEDNSGGKDITLEPFEIIPIRYPDPDSVLRGAGPLRAAARTVDLEDYSETWNTNFFNNAAAPNLALETDKVLSQEVRDKLAAKVKQNYEGVRNAHKTIVLESGLKAKSLTISQKDMDFIEQQRFSRDKIMGIFRVPKTILGLTEEVNRATAEASEYVFAKYTIKPKLEGFIQQLNEFLLPLFDKTGTMYFDYEDPVPANVELKIAQATSGVGGGYMTINEARELFGLDPIEGGDTVREPVSMNPLELSDGRPMTAKRRKKETLPAQRKVAMKSNTRFKNYKIVEQIKANLEEKMTEIIYSALNQKRVKTVAEKFVGDIFKGTEVEQKAAKLAFQELQLNIADDYEPKFIQKLNKVFEEQKKEILARITENINPDKGILDVNEERVRYEKTLKSTFMGLMQKQTEEALKLIGQQKKFKALSLRKILEQYFLARVFRFSGEVTRNTNRLVGEALLAGLSAGEGVPKLQSRISQLFTDMEVYRAERIARSETIRATNFAAEEAWVDSGVVEAKEWVTFRDERTDDECIDMDGKIIPLRENFFNKGDKMGNLEFDYEKIQHPPLHVNCRCTLVPIVLPAGGAGQWRPSMGKAQANEFIKDSAYKGTLYHGTTVDAANNIRNNGFNLTRGAGNVVDGVYFASERRLAEDYAMSATGIRGGRPSTLEVKVNIRKIKEFSWHGLYDYVAEKLGSGFGPEDVKNLLQREGIDAIRVADEVANQTYLAVFDPKNVVVLNQ